MELFVLNKNFEIVALLDSFSSLEWVRRYDTPGDFVFKTIATTENISILTPRAYIAREDDETIYQIEKIYINTSLENGDTLQVSGRSLEKILGQRIVWKQTNSTSGETAEEFIRRLINENAISPSDPNRKIPRLKLGTAKGFTEKIDKQLTGDNLLTAISDICKTYQYGFKITMNDSGDLIFDLYKGIDRSYNQSENPFVIFADDYDNILNTSYEYDESNISNVALIGGEGEGIDRKYQTIGNYIGIDRYEIFVDAKDVSSNNGEISQSEYSALLIERGKEKIAENTFTESYDGELETSNTYIYKQDYSIGDVVQVENKYGLTAAPRIIEIIESQNENGYRVVPTFGSWEA